MNKSFDIVLKVMVEAGPDSWPGIAHLPTAPVTVSDADVSTVGGAADKVLRVETDPPYLLHLDFFAGHDTAWAAPKLLWYNAALSHRHRLQVRSVAVLLRPESDSPRLTGELVQALPDHPPHVVFRYDVFRVWEQPPEVFLTGSLGLLPLAPVSAATEGQLPAVIEQMKRRLSQRRARPLAGELWTATWVLLGLKYSREAAHRLLRGITAMEESTTYQEIIEIGEARGLINGVRQALLLLGEERFGSPPDRATQAAIEAIGDREQLNQLLRRALEVNTWKELLHSPARPRRPRGRRSSQ